VPYWALSCSRTSRWGGLPHLNVDKLYGVLALFRPHHGAVPVVVGDDGDVAVLRAVGDLVHPDAIQGLEAGVVHGLGHDPDNDGGHRLPRTAKQPGDRGLVGALGEPGDHVLEVLGVLGVPGAGTYPGHCFGASSAT
jgi:hypothetical protein